MMQNQVKSIPSQGIDASQSSRRDHNQIVEQSATIREPNDSFIHDRPILTSKYYHVIKEALDESFMKFVEVRQS